MRRRWRNAAIDLPETTEAVIMIRAARTSGVRGLIAEHCWLLLKPANGPWERWDVVGRRARTGRVGLQRNARSPHEGWMGRRGRTVLALRGSAAAAALPEITAAIARYPGAHRYCAWPGPNCNSFVAWLTRAVPALRTALPPLAIGKDFLPHGPLAAPAPSGTGWQISLFGLAGILMAREEGIELQLLGAVLGLRPRRAELLIPGLGALALRRGVRPP